MPTPEQLATDPENLPELGEIEEARAALRQADERAALDKHFDELVARAPEMTEEQAARIRRLFRYGPTDDPRGITPP